jgi:hypothetical protein
MDIFNVDAFGVQTLTAAINNPPKGQVVPNVLDALFAPGEQGIITTVVSIERDNDGLALVPAAERGSPGTPVSQARRDAVPFQTFHLPLSAPLIADEIQGVRAFGSETELQTVQAMVNRYLFKLRRQIEATQVFHRMGAITGKIYDANGSSLLLDTFVRFNLQQQQEDFHFSAVTTDVAQAIRVAKRAAEDVIGGSGMITGWLGLCGRNWFDGFIGHDAVVEAYKFWSAAGSPLRNDVRGGFSFGDVTWQEFYGKVGSTLFIDPDTAYLIPVGVQDLFISRYAPANYIETVNTMGLPFYAKQEPMRMGKGIDIEAQSNPLHLCTKPHAVIKLTKS